MRILKKSIYNQAVDQVSSRNFLVWDRVCSQIKNQVNNHVRDYIMDRIMDQIEDNTK